VSPLAVVRPSNSSSGLARISASASASSMFVPISVSKMRGIFSAGGDI